MAGGLEPMSRLGLPYLSLYMPSLPAQRDKEPVIPRDGAVRVGEHWPDRPYKGKRVAPFFVVWAPGPYDAAGQLVPCSARTCRRWVEAALAYAGAVDGISAELTAAHRRVVAAPWWNPLAAGRARRDWEETRQRYERVVREAGDAYEPVGRDIRDAVRAEKDKAAARALEVARQEAEDRRHRARLAERPVWGWTATARAPEERAAYVFRHDVPRGDGPAPPPGQEAPRLGLTELRRALMELKPARLHWDGAALAETERELGGVAFAGWWRELFYEDHRTFTSPPPGHGPAGRGDPTGGTGTAGTGGFTGGFSCGGGY